MKITLADQEVSDGDFPARFAIWDSNVATQPRLYADRVVFAWAWHRREYGDIHDDQRDDVEVDAGKRSRSTGPVYIFRYQR